MIKSVAKLSGFVADFLPGYEFEKLRFVCIRFFEGYF